MGTKRILGSVTPRIYTPPLRDLEDPKNTWGYDVIWFAKEILKEPLSPWQEWFVIHALELLPREAVQELYPDNPAVWEREIPRYKTILLMIARQNGKTHVAKVLIKWALFRKRLPKIMGAAQTKNDAKDLWEEIVEECESNPSLKKRMRRTTHANGAECLRSKWSTYRIASIERGAARGKTNDFLFMDEMREHTSWKGYSALSSTTLSPVGAFNFLASNAGDDDSIVLASIRSGAISGIDSGSTEGASVGIFEWSADPDGDIDDHNGWAQANPDLGHGRMTIRDIQAERDAKTDDEFRTENLCQWVAELTEEFIPIIDYDEWADKHDPRPRNTGDNAVAIDLDWGGTEIAVVSAVKCGDKYYLSLSPLRVFDREEAIAGIVRARDANDPVSVLMEMTGERSTLHKPLVDEGIEPDVIKRTQAADATALFLRLFLEGRIIHDGSPRWLEALGQAEVKRTSSGSQRIHNSPELVAASFAVWGLQEFGIPSSPPEIKTKKRFTGAPKPVTAKRMSRSF